MVIGRNPLFWIVVLLGGMLGACGEAASGTSSQPSSSPETDTITRSPARSTPTQVAYVAARAGLVLRQAADRTSPAIMTLPYGTQVALSVGVERDSSYVDQLRGVMAPATAQGKSGFLFTGYLVSVPPPPLTHPHRIRRVAEYAATLQDSGHAQRFVDPNGQGRPWGLTLPVHDLQSAFLIGRVLFGIPQDYHFPAADRVALSSANHPSPAVAAGPFEHVAQAYTRDYTADGQLIGITFIDDNEVGGRKVVFREEAWGWRIQQEDWAH